MTKSRHSEGLGTQMYLGELKHVAYVIARPELRSNSMSQLNGDNSVECRAWKVRHYFLK